ncbi:hypothetical protein GH714_010665 [Hevea brasiliensis]|uniref:Uncharacterized protein n=1 Tax=Hevea brasiliensis TaxID=3981 RepID=A0A6A6KCQ5_HEVBR|nr:hypothetical protein GH714_010665 [Hevea brasiliensis]
MDSVKPSSVTPKKSSLARTVAKVLHLRAATGIAPVDGVQKVKSQEQVKNDNKIGNKSTISLPYAQLQCAQSPYDVDGIQAADKLVVSELKNLSALKQCHLKKQFDPSPETTLLLAEVQEQKSVSKTYEIMGKKLESQLRLRTLRSYIFEKNWRNLIDRTSYLRKDWIEVDSCLCLTIFTYQMEAADWNLDAAANSIVSDVVYWRADDKCFAFECFVCREMFEAFNLPNFSLPCESLPKGKNKQHYFLRRFTELKSVKAKEHLAENPKSTFAKFCRAKYLQLVHPQMETSFFGNLSQRNLVNSGEFPDTTFFTSFAEMAKRVWLLHCLAFSFEPEASIFQVRSGCRFSEVYMECVCEDALLSSENAPEADPPVAFTVVPGFKIGKTIIQCQVYLSQIQTKVNR